MIIKVDYLNYDKIHNDGLYDRYYFDHLYFDTISKHLLYANSNTNNVHYYKSYRVDNELAAYVYVPILKKTKRVCFCPVCIEERFKNNDLSERAQDIIYNILKHTK